MAISRTTVLQESLWKKILLYVIFKWFTVTLINSIVTHWTRNKVAAIFQTTFSNAFSWMKINKLRLRFHWNLFSRVQVTMPALVQILACHRPGAKPIQSINFFYCINNLQPKGWDNYDKILTRQITTNTTNNTHGNYLNQWCLVYWCIYASLCLNELNLINTQW